MITVVAQTVMMQRFALYVFFVAERRVLKTPGVRSKDLWIQSRHPRSQSIRYGFPTHMHDVENEMKIRIARQFA